MKAVLVFADGRIDRRNDCESAQWWPVMDTGKQPHQTRYFKACEVAHTATDQNVEPVGDHVLIYAEQPRVAFEGRIEVPHLRVVK